MPVTYPPRPGTITTDGVSTISRFLNSPALITRRLRTLTDRMFIGDRILPNRVAAIGGMVEYETGESIYPARASQFVEPHGEFPLTTVADGEVKLASVKKYAIATDVTLESVQRRAMDPVDRAMTKLKNGVVRDFDTAVVNAIVAAGIPTLAGASWATGTTTILRQLLNAIALINDKQEGYEANTLLVNHYQYAAIMSDPVLLGMIQRESVDTPVYSGQLERIAGLEIVVKPSGGTLSDPIVYDNTQLGGIAEERGPNADENGVEAISSYFNFSIGGGDEYWRLGAKRVAVPIVQEVSAAIRITGTAVSTPS